MSAIRDKRLAERLTQWEKGAWEEFCARFDTRILHVAVRWCGPACRIDCPGYGGEARYRPRKDLVCPTAFDAYTFIIEEIVKRLGSYRGECTLDTWIHPLLTPSRATTSGYDYRKLFTDWLRRHKGRIHVPKCLANLTPSQRQVFLLLARGNERADILDKVGISAEEFETIHELIGDRLKEESYSLYWQFLGDSDRHHQPLSLDQNIGGDESEGALTLEVADQRLSPEAMTQAQALLALIRQGVRAQSPTEQALLSLRYDKTEGSGLCAPLDANQIAEVFRGMGHQEITTREVVYVRLRTLRVRLIRHIEKALGEKLTLTDSGMDGILDEWGTGTPEIAEQIIRAHERIVAAQTPSGDAV